MQNNPSDKTEPETIIIENGFEILGLLGSGGMGCVYKCLDQKLERLVAIKMLHKHLSSNTKSNQRFLQEAKTTAKLDHPNIVKIFAVGINSQGQPYFVSEFLAGKTLSEILQATPVLANDLFFEIFEQILNGLSAAHSQGIVHRDLKPSNIMINQSEEKPLQVTILDFGIAQLLQEELNKGQSLTKTGEIIGSPNYISPEQSLANKTDQRSDIYSLGCMMYECLTGKLPFETDSAFSTIYKHAHEPIPAFANRNKAIKIDPELEKLVFKCLEKDPNKRFSSCQELKSALSNYRQHKVFYQQQPEKKSQINTGILIAIIAFFVLVSMIWQQTQPNNKKPKTQEYTANTMNVNPLHSHFRIGDFETVRNLFSSIEGFQGEQKQSALNEVSKFTNQMITTLESHKLSNHKALFTAYVQRALLEILLLRFDAANTMLQKADKLIGPDPQDAPPAYKIILLRLYGDLECAKGNFAKAISFYRACIKRQSYPDLSLNRNSQDYAETELNQALPHAYGKISSISESQGNLKQAIEFKTYEFKKWDESKTLHSSVSTGIQLAELLRKNKEIPAADKLVHSLIADIDKLAKDEHHRTVTIRIYAMVADYYIRFYGNCALAREQLAKAEKVASSSSLISPGTLLYLKNVKSSLLQAKENTEQAPSNK